MDNPFRILFVDDEPADIAFEQAELERSCVVFTSHTAVSETELRQELVQFDPDVVLCDYGMTGFSGLRALETVRALCRNTCCLADWKRLGVRIAVDDFGTGYSGLSYLSQLPIDRLKLDRSFVRRMAKHSKDATILSAVIALGRELGFTVIAEGVETAEQLTTLRDLGCQQVQGFLLGRPLGASDTHLLLTDRQARSRPISEYGQRASSAG